MRPATRPLAPTPRSATTACSLPPSSACPTARTGSATPPSRTPSTRPSWASLLPNGCSPRAPGGSSQRPLGWRPVPDRLEELTDWLRIPSISTGGGDPDDIARACDWICERVRAAGGECAPVVGEGGNPIAVGDRKATRDGAPPVLIYGHSDVQSTGPLEAWETPPFEPTIRGAR